VAVRLVASISFSVASLLGGSKSFYNNETAAVQQHYGAFFWIGFLLAVGLAEALWV